MSAGRREAAEGASAQVATQGAAKVAGLPTPMAAATDRAAHMSATSLMTASAVAAAIVTTVTAVAALMGMVTSAFVRNAGAPLVAACMRMRGM